MLYGYFYLQRYTFGEVNLNLKRSFLFQLFVIVFITIFCALGTWQLYRLQWKLELIKEISFGLESDSIGILGQLTKIIKELTLLENLILISKFIFIA